MALDPDLRRRLHRVAQKAREATIERDELIRQAKADGGTLREIADAVGLTHPGVARVLKRGPAASDGN